jgi:hypothetical protein
MSSRAIVQQHAGWNGVIGLCELTNSKSDGISRLETPMIDELTDYFTTSTCIFCMLTKPTVPVGMTMTFLRCIVLEYSDYSSASVP